MAEDDNTAKTLPPRRWLRIALVISLALNLVVIGVVSGSSMKWFANGGPPRAFDFSLGPVGRALSDEDRRAIGADLRQRQDLSPPSRRDFSRATETVTELLRADPFDDEAFAAQLRAAAERSQQVQTAAQEALVRRIAAMSGDERAAMADRIAEYGRKRD